MIRRLRPWLVLLVFVMNISPAFAVQEKSVAPDVVIDHFHATLLSVMKHAKRLGYKGRYRQLDPVVRQSYDLPRVIRVVSGKYWRELSHEKRLRFLHVFSRLVVATYAHRFDSYSGERFRRVSERPLAHANVLVRTEIIKHDGKRVHLDYVLRRRKGNWRIINVIADGVSDLALKRVEYTTVLRKEGFEVLLSKLKAKIAQYE